MAKKACSRIFKVQMLSTRMHSLLHGLGCSLIPLSFLSLLETAQCTLDVKAKIKCWIPINSFRQFLGQQSTPYCGSYRIGLNGVGDGLNSGSSG